MYCRGSECVKLYFHSLIRLHVAQGQLYLYMFISYHDIILSYFSFNLKR